MAGIIPAPGGGSSGSKFRRRRYTPIADINVTPLVDVMLVLLIIFMVTAPLLQVGVPVDLPKTSAQQVGGKDEPLVVSVNSKGEVFLGETKYEIAELGAKLKAVHEEKPDQRVFMRGDKTVDYGKMMEVMGVVIDSGFRQLGLLGEQAQALGRRRHRHAGRSRPAAPRAPQHRRQPRSRPRGARQTEAKRSMVESLTPPASRCAHRPSCRRWCMSSCWGRRCSISTSSARPPPMEPEPVMVEFEAIDKKAAAPTVGNPPPQPKDVPIAEETTKAPPPKTAEPPPAPPHAQAAEVAEPPKPPDAAQAGREAQARGRQAGRGSRSR